MELIVKDAVGFQRRARESVARWSWEKPLLWTSNSPGALAVRAISSLTTESRSDECPPDSMRVYAITQSHLRMGVSVGEAIRQA